MSNVESTRSQFFPKSKDTTRTKRGQFYKNKLQRNDEARKTKLDQIASRDAKVAIPEAVKDFGRIKRVTDSLVNPDQSEKINRLREQINSGNYEIDYEALAHKILSEEL